MNALVIVFLAFCKLIFNLIGNTQRCNVFFEYFNLAFLQVSIGKE